MTLATIARIRVRSFVTEKEGRIDRWRMDLATRTWRSWIVALFVITAMLLQCVGGYQIAVKRTECFSQSMESENYVVTGNFVVVNKGTDSVAHGDDVEMQVTGPTGNKVLHVKASRGHKFEFKVTQTGFYKICFVNPSGAPKTVDFGMRVGHGDGPDEKDLAKKEHFDPLEAKIVQLREALEKVSLEQQYYKARDLRHRKTNESTRKRLFWYTISEYFCLVGVSVAQVYLVRSLFSKRVGYNSV